MVATALLILVLACTNVPEVIITDDITDGEFISAIHNGFAASYFEAEKAKELGSGKADFCTADNLKTYATLTWVAWIDDQGILNLAINGLVTERVLGPVWAYSGADPIKSGRRPEQWAGWRTYCVTDTAGNCWIRHKENAFVTVLKLGIASENALAECFKKLEGFGVCK